ncbi:hypothetical protein EAG_01572 [Camponotus floridanus]|uniref:Uncharacterized protein n=1 Tax=Camponotus floridanus TaxID=104421 RepID=E2AVW0_CAMFO|nr:hypothetical protein EAG_01572 [Camponotus floridanus]
MRTTGHGQRGQRSECATTPQPHHKPGFASPLSGKVRRAPPLAASARPANRGPRAGQGRLMSSDPIRRRRQLKEVRDQSWCE